MCGQDAPKNEREKGKNGEVKKSYRKMGQQTVSTFGICPFFRVYAEITLLQTKLQK